MTLLLALALAAAPAAPADESIATLKTLDEVMALPALHAKGTHVVHFWATWCAPCRDELPELLARAHELAKQGVDFTFLAVDAPEAVESEMRPLLLRDGGFFVGATHKLVGPDVDSDALMARFAKDWQGTVPATFVFRDGKQVGDFRGAREAHALDGLGPKRAKKSR